MNQPGAGEPRPGAVARAKASAAARWVALRSAHPSVRHAAAAWARLQNNNGGQYAAAITYFSFLALFPLLLLAVAVTGFVLHSHPAAQQSLLTHITDNVPGSLGTTLRKSVRTAIAQRAGVGVVGLVGLLLSGLGWIGNLRAAVDAVWGTRPAKRNFVKAKLANLLVLAGLGLGLVLSLGLTVVGTAVTDQILNGLGLLHVSGLHYVVTILTFVISVAGDLLIFLWVLVRLPRADVPRAAALKGALLAAVGFEVLKVLGTYTIAKSAQSATAGPFAGLLAVLIWIQLVARFMLFCAAMTAVLTDDAEVAASTEVLVAADELPGEVPVNSPLSPVAVAGSLLGVGAAAGAAAVVWATRRRPADQGAAAQSRR
jgi:membrane protein